MDDYIMNLAFGNMNKELVLYVLSVGYLSFFTYFYGSEKWSKFTDIDKIAFSLISGFIVLNFLVIPIAYSLKLIYNFFFFVDESHLLNPISDEKVYNLFLICTILILVSFRHYFKKPLYKNEEVHYFIFKIVMFYIIFLILLTIYLEIIFYFIENIDYTSYLTPGLLKSTIRLILFISVYIFIHEDLISLIHQYINSVKSNFKFDRISWLSVIVSYMVIFFRRLRSSVSRLKDSIKINFHLDRKKSPSAKIGFIIAIIAISLFTGYFMLKPSINRSEPEVYEVNVDYVAIGADYIEMEGSKTFTEYYMVRTPLLIPLVKIKVGSAITDAYRTNNRNFQYDINFEENYFIINNRSKENVTVKFTEKFEGPKNFTELGFGIVYPKFVNETENICILLENNFSSTIIIEELQIECDSNYIPIEVNKLRYVKDETPRPSSDSINESESSSKYDIDRNFLTFEEPTYVPSEGNLTINVTYKRSNNH
ncbi:MAG: hypothetical protein AB3K77_08235 [Methanosarcinaceae archaeon]